MLEKNTDAHMSDTRACELVTLTTEIISAYASKNPVPIGDLGGLIRHVHSAMSGLDAAAVQEQPAPAVPISKSVSPATLICLFDGKRFKTLRRHLRTAHGMTPEKYRSRWELSATFPMVAPNYAAVRSNMAKAIGLGVGGHQRGGRKAKA